MSVQPQRRPPLVVIANSQELHTRTLESVLGPHGFAIVRAYTGKQVLDRCRTARPDAIILDADMPDMDGIDVCRELRNDPLISASTAILITSSGSPSRQERVEALRAGAWDYLGAGFDDEELPLRLQAYIRAKFEADRTREESQVDASTGMYNLRGLARRARELGSLAFRNHEPLVCVVFSVAGDDEEAATDVQMTKSSDRLARTLRERGRLSDATGRLGPSEFAVIAEGIEAEGAQKMADRLTSELRKDPSLGRGVRVVAGYDVVDDYRETPREPSEMIARASRAMHQSRVDAGGEWIRQFEGVGQN